MKCERAKTQNRRELELAGEWLGGSPSGSLVLSVADSTKVTSSHVMWSVKRIWANIPFSFKGWWNIFYFLLPKNIMLHYDLLH